MLSCTGRTVTNETLEYVTALSANIHDTDDRLNVWKIVMDSILKFVRTVVFYKNKFDLVYKKLFKHNFL